MTAITAKKIAELRALHAERKNPQIWQTTDGGHIIGQGLEGDGQIEVIARVENRFIRHHPYASELIVSSVNALPDLLDEIESLRANNAEAWAECERLRMLAGDVPAYRAQNSALRKACVLALDFSDSVVYDGGDLSSAFVSEKLREVLGVKS